MTILVLAASVALLVVGVALSAFFSGSETAYYRQNRLRVAINAQHGDAEAKRILWFIRRPADFVATVLVGNNVANYLVTVALGLALVSIVPSRSNAAEIIFTVLLSPIVFLFGELVPKNVNYLQPLRSLEAKIRVFRWFYTLFRPLSYPVVELTRRLQTEGGDNLVPRLARLQLGDLILQGQTEGVLTDTQVQLANALLAAGNEPIESHVLTTAVMGLPASVDRDAALAHAHRYGLTWLALEDPARPGRWVGSVSVGQLLGDQSARSPLQLAKLMPQLDAAATRLDASRLIRESGGGYGIVRRDGDYLGLVSLQAIVAPVFRA